MSDVVWKVYNTQDVDNGGARVEAPKGLGHLARFTGCPPCTV